jgi:hypothetical protein
LEILGNKIFENVFAHLRRKSSADQVGRRFARTEPGQADLLLDPGNHSLGLAIDLLDRNRNFNFVFATFD